MSRSVIPAGYKPVLSLYETQSAIGFIKRCFEDNLSNALNLTRVSAPLFVEPQTGLNDDLNGIERPVEFEIKETGTKAQIVHSLAKWKRMALYEYDFPVGEGIYTDMNAVRRDEEMDNLHSIYVDQWDWEKSINAEDRNVNYLKNTVNDIYALLKEIEIIVYEQFPHITPVLPDEITFIHAEELLQMYPDLQPRDREMKASEKYGAIFLIGIGGALSNGEKHDGRAPDYDDWSTPNGDGYLGLNGDIVLWNNILKTSFELSSMGIRVDKEAMKYQLDISGCPERAELNFHKALLSGELPSSIGGGIGQSRLCMFFLQKAHVGEVQASIWPEEQIKICEENKIYLL